MGNLYCRLLIPAVIFYFQKKLEKEKEKNTSTPIPGADLPLWHVHEEESDR
jgi:hypothetical protein